MAAKRTRARPETEVDTKTSDSPHAILRQYGPELQLALSAFLERPASPRDEAVRSAADRLVAALEKAGRYKPPGNTSTGGWRPRKDTAPQPARQRLTVLSRMGLRGETPGPSTPEINSLLAALHETCDEPDLDHLLADAQAIADKDAWPDLELLGSVRQWCRLNVELRHVVSFLRFREKRLADAGGVHVLVSRLERARTMVSLLETLKDVQPADWLAAGEMVEDRLARALLLWATIKGPMDDDRQVVLALMTTYADACQGLYHGTLSEPVPALIASVDSLCMSFRKRPWAKALGLPLHPRLGDFPEGPYGRWIDNDAYVYEPAYWNEAEGWARDVLRLMSEQSAPTDRSLRRRAEELVLPSGARWGTPLTLDAFVGVARTTILDASRRGSGEAVMWLVTLLEAADVLRERYPALGPPPLLTDEEPVVQMQRLVAWASRGISESAAPVQLAGDGTSMPEQRAGAESERGAGPAPSEPVGGEADEEEHPLPGLPCTVVPTHSDDYTSVNWFGTEHTFTKGQAAAVKVLWEQWKKGQGTLAQETIGERLNPDHTGKFRLRDVFRQRVKGKTGTHPAWGTMIREGRRGTYGLVPPDSPEVPT